MFAGQCDSCRLTLEWQALNALQQMLLFVSLLLSYDACTKVLMIMK